MNDNEQVILKIMDEMKACGYNEEQAFLWIIKDPNKAYTSELRQYADLYLRNYIQA